MDRQSMLTQGDKAEYTGVTEVKHGVRWFFVEFITGHRKGETIAVSECPECGMRYYQSRPVGCSTCQLDTAPILASDIKRGS